MIIIETIWDAIRFVFHILYNDSAYLCLGILLAVAIRVYVDIEKIKSLFVKRSGVPIFSSVTFGALTPFCACGSMAITLSMFAAALPLGTIMAFLTSSALMSPSAFVLYSGIVGVGFAVALTLASVFIGVSSGYATMFLEKRTDFFRDQIRMAKQCGCKSSCCSSSDAVKYYRLDKLEKVSLFKKLKLDEFAKEFYKMGVKVILPYFCLFAFLSFFVERFLPKDWVVAAFGASHFYSVPLAALVGLPLYVGSAAALPLIQTLLKSGASHGAILAFMVTGPGTSIAVMTGLGIILRRKAIGIYVVFMFMGAVISGYLYDLYLLISNGG